MTMKERIEMINDTAQENFDMAKGMLTMFNEIYGTKYGFLAKRVVSFRYPDGSTAERYAHCKDVSVNLDL